MWAAEPSVASPGTRAPPLLVRGRQLSQCRGQRWGLRAAGGGGRRGLGAASRSRLKSGNPSRDLRAAPPGSALEGRGRPIFPADFIVPRSVLEETASPAALQGPGLRTRASPASGKEPAPGAHRCLPGSGPALTRPRPRPTPLPAARQGFPASSATLYKVSRPFLSFFFFSHFLCFH